MNTRHQATFFILSLCLFIVLFTSCEQGNEKDELAKLKKEIDSLKTIQQKQADELAIRELAHKFSDAANRRDAELFQSLWSPDGKWIIGPPVGLEFGGKDQMGASVTKMLGLWDFFVQITGPGVVELDNNRAKARFYVNEIARGKDGKGNFNLSMYEDELVKIDGSWFFSKRTYKTIYQDAPVYKGLIQAIN